MDTMFQNGSRPFSENEKAILCTDACTNKTCRHAAAVKSNPEEKWSNENFGLVCCGLAQLLVKGVQEDVAAEMFLEQVKSEEVAKRYKCKLNQLIPATFSKVDQFRDQKVVHNISSVPVELCAISRADFAATVAFQQQHLSEEQRAVLKRLDQDESRIVLAAAQINAFNHCWATDKKKFKKLIHKFNKKYRCEIEYKMTQD